MADEENMDTVPVEETKEDTPVVADEAAAKTTTVGGVIVEIDEVQMPLVIVFVASIILLVATGAIYNWWWFDSYSKYAISVSSISLSISAICLLMHKFACSMYEKLGKNLCLLNFTWSFVGACFLTFKGPFEATSNGYFAAWATLYGTAMSLGMDSNTFKTNIRGLGAIMGHMAASIVFLLACITKVESSASLGTKERNNAIYGLSLACFSTVVVLVLMMMDRKGNAIKGVMNLALMTVLSVMWLVAACLVTFDGPFTATGNGYFSAWAACITAAYAAVAAKKTM